jgi:hypothetical protein
MNPISRCGLTRARCRGPSGRKIDATATDARSWHRPPAGCRLAGKSGDGQQPKRIEMENQQNGRTGWSEDPLRQKTVDTTKAKKQGKLGELIGKNKLWSSEPGTQVTYVWDGLQQYRRCAHRGLRGGDEFRTAARSRTSPKPLIKMLHSCGMIKYTEEPTCLHEPRPPRRWPAMCGCHCCPTRPWTPTPREESELFGQQKVWQCPGDCISLVRTQPPRWQELAQFGARTPAAEGQQRQSQAESESHPSMASRCPQDVCEPPVFWVGEGVGWWC